jgi:hypothetical protein
MSEKAPLLGAGPGAPRLTRVPARRHYMVRSAASVTAMMLFTAGWLWTSALLTGMATGIWHLVSQHDAIRRR